MISSSNNCKNYVSKLVFEIFWVAVVMTIIGAICYHILTHIFRNMVLPISNNNKYLLYIIYASFGFSGMLLHLSCEILGINTWYILHSAAACAL